MPLPVRISARFFNQRRCAASALGVDAVDDLIGGRFTEERRRHRRNGGRVDADPSRPRPRPPRTDLRRRGFATDTYYDSQSGRHVPVHDEGRVTAYLRSRDGFRPDLVDARRSVGAAGLMLTAAGEPSLSRTPLESLTSLAEENARWTVFLRMPPRGARGTGTDDSYVTSLLKNAPTSSQRGIVNLCIEHGNGGNIPKDVASANETLYSMSIGIFDPSYYVGEDPISTASEIASIIDSVAAAEAVSGGPSISHIVLDPPPRPDLDGDSVVSLAQELAYLDVPGPTVKSRLVVPAMDDKQLEECLGMGISKYIVDEGGGASEGMEMLRSVVEEEGKELVFVE